MKKENSSGCDKKVDNSKIDISREQSIANLPEIIPGVIRAGTPLLSLMVEVGGASMSLLVSFWLVMTTITPLVEVLGVAMGPTLTLLTLYLVLAVLERVLQLFYKILRLLVANRV